MRPSRKCDQHKKGEGRETKPRQWKGTRINDKAPQVGSELRTFTCKHGVKTPQEDIQATQQQRVRPRPAYHHDQQKTRRPSLTNSDARAHMHDDPLRRSPLRCSARKMHALLAAARERRGNSAARPPPRATKWWYVRRAIERGTGGVDDREDTNVEAIKIQRCSTAETGIIGF